MSFLKLVIKNVLRNKTRSLLTILGISIGIATIVALGLVTGSMGNMVKSAMSTGKADFTVAKSGSADIVLSFISEDIVEQIKNDVAGIEKTAGVLIGMQPYGNNPYFMIWGMRPEDVGFLGQLTAGNPPAADQDEVLLGKIAQNVLQKNIGDTVEFNNKPYKVTGIFETGTSMQDGGALMPLGKLQEVIDQQGNVSLIFAQVADGADTRQVADAVNEKYPNQLVAIIDLNDLDSVDQGMKIINASSWAISLLAIVIGGIGVMNTIIMSVFERTREIGILRAVGWSRRRVLCMIIGESLVLGLIAVVVGTGLGLIMVEFVKNSDIVKSFIDIEYTSTVFVQAFAVGMGVVLLGGVYPAYKATRLSPLEALRHE